MTLVEGGLHAVELELGHGRVRISERSITIPSSGCRSGHNRPWAPGVSRSASGVMMVIGAAGLAAPGEDVENDGGGMDALAQCASAQAASTAASPSLSTDGQDLDHLPVAIIGG